MHSKAAASSSELSGLLHTGSGLWVGPAVPLSLTAWGQGGSRGQMRLLLCSAHGPRPRGKQEAAVRWRGQSSARCQRDEDPGDVQYVRCDAPVTPMGRDTGNGAVRPPTARAAPPVCRDSPASLKPLHIPRTRMEARFPCPVMERSPGAVQAAFGWAPAPRKVPVGSCGHVGTRAGLPALPSGGAGCFGCRGFSGPPGHHTLPTERASSCAHLPTRCLVGQLCNRILTEHLTAWRKHPHPPSCASGPPPRAPLPSRAQGPALEPVPLTPNVREQTHRKTANSYTAELCDPRASVPTCVSMGRVLTPAPWAAGPSRCWAPATLFQAGLPSLTG